MSQQHTITLTAAQLQSLTWALEEAQHSFNIRALNTSRRDDPATMDAIDTSIRDCTELLAIVAASKAP